MSKPHRWAVHVHDVTGTKILTTLTAETVAAAESIRQDVGRSQRRCTIYDTKGLREYSNEDRLPTEAELAFQDALSEILWREGDGKRMSGEPGVHPFWVWPELPQGLDRDEQALRLKEQLEAIAVVVKGRFSWREREQCWAFGTHDDAEMAVGAIMGLRAPAMGR